MTGFIFKNDLKGNYTFIHFSIVDDPLPNLIFITKEKALFIRSLRTDKLYSYDAIADECKKQIKNADWEISESVGKYLCEIAANILGENPDTSPWNDDN